MKILLILICLTSCSPRINYEKKCKQLEKADKQTVKPVRQKGKLIFVGVFGYAIAIALLGEAFFE